MKILGIESSCDETAVSVVEDGRRLLSDVIASQVDEHVQYGGVVPEIASRRHAENISGCAKRALSDASCTLEDIDAIAVTYAPGLIGALLVGVNFAKGLAAASGKPLVPVHHLRGHIAANYLTHPDLEPPFLALVVSGGHSHIVRVRDYTSFEILGRTRDDAAGECLDKAARAMGLPYPGGKNLDAAAKNGDARAFSFPHPQVEDAPMDMSFSGLKTYVINLIHRYEQRGEPIDVASLGASYIKAVVDCLTERVVMALDLTGEKKLVVAGGVSANSVLRRELDALAEKRGIALYKPRLSLCGDNGAMIASQGYYEYRAGCCARSDLNAYATMAIDINGYL